MGFINNLFKKSNTEINTTQLYKIINESATLCNTTTKPDVFFIKYDLLVGNLHKLASLGEKLTNESAPTSHSLQEVLDNRDAQTKLFIDRYAAASKTLILNKNKEKIYYDPAEKFKANMKLYKSYLSEDNQNYVNELYLELKKVASK